MQNFSKYLLYGALEADWGFCITSVGYTKIDIDAAYPPNNQHPESNRFNWDTGRVLDDYYLVFITRGEGLFESAVTKAAKIKEGTCFLLFPGVWHRYKPSLKSGWEEYWVGFRGTYPDLLMQQFTSAHPFIAIGKNDHLLKQFQLLITRVQEAAPGYHQTITGIVLQMLGLVQAALRYHGLNASSTEKLIEEGKFLLREAIQSIAPIEKIVNKLPVGYSKFRKDFKAITGHSPNQYLIDLKLDKAKELLEGTGLSISEIAYQTGFESVFYFSKLFKSRNSVSPRAFRKA